MAEVSTTSVSTPDFIESEAKLYLDQLREAIGGLKGMDLSKIMGPEFVAGLDPLTQQAMSMAGGLGAYEPFLKEAAALRGPTAYQAYMSPYQQDVIQTTLQEFDVQAQKGLPSLASQAISAGAFGGGREGVQRAVYGSESDRNRAALQAQLLQQGFGQAQQLAQQDYLRNIQLAQQAPALAGQQISALTTLGGLGQAQQQAQLTAQQQLAQQQFYQPLNLAQQYGSGIMGLISGYPGRTITETTPSMSPLQTGISAGATLAGIYRAFG